MSLVRSPDFYSLILPELLFITKIDENFIQFVINCDFPSGSTYWQYVKNGKQQKVSSTVVELLHCSPYNTRIVVMDNNYSAFLNGEMISEFYYRRIPKWKSGINIKHIMVEKLLLLLIIFLFPVIKK